MSAAARRGLWATAVCTALLGASAVWVDTAGATPPVGATGTLVSQARTDDRVRMHTHGPSDTRIVRIVIDSGGDNGWHSHPGPVLVSVVRGTATAYLAHDHGCLPHVHGAGDGFFEAPGHVHIVRNEGTEPLVLYAVSVVPAGQPGAVDEPSPGNCPF